MSGVKGCNPLVFDGAIDGVRTRDLRLGKPPLCQLSYYRMGCLPSMSGDRHLILTRLFIFYCTKGKSFFSDDDFRHRCGDGRLHDGDHDRLRDEGHGRHHGGDRDRHHDEDHEDAVLLLHSLRAWAEGLCG